MNVYLKIAFVQTQFSAALFGFQKGYHNSCPNLALVSFSLKCDQLSYTSFSTLASIDNSEMSKGLYKVDSSTVMSFLTFIIFVGVSDFIKKKEKKIGATQNGAENNWANRVCKTSLFKLQ